MLQLQSCGSSVLCICVGSEFEAPATCLPPGSIRLYSPRVSHSKKNKIRTKNNYRFHISRVIQAPRRIGGLSYNPSTSAFNVYKKNHDVFMSQGQSQQAESSSSPITAEDEEVAAILSNALPPGEYVRRHYGH